MLECFGVGMRFGQTSVLQDVSFAAPRGEILALCGENGAGKSTLMNIIAGVLPHGAYSGTVHLDGSELISFGPRAAEQRGVSLLPQELSYYPDLSVAENMLTARIPSWHGVISIRSLRRRADDLAASVGLATDVDTPMRKLPTAECQLVCIARALSFQPRLLILDEPTAALPRPAADRLFDLVRRLAGDGCVVLYISHHLTEVVGLADRVMVLRNGVMTMAPTPKPSVEEIVEAMVGSEMIPAEHASRRGRIRFNTPVLRASIDRVELAGQPVVSDIQLDVHAGEIVGIAGLTGSGRETLMETLAGISRGRAGAHVEISGTHVRNGSPRSMRRAGVFYIPEDRRADGLVSPGSVWQNVLLGLEARFSIAGLRRVNRERDAVNQAIISFGVQPPDPDREASSLSGGNQQKALLARTAVQCPAVMLLCEPTRGVDVGARLKLYELIVRAADNGVAVVISTADASELVELCDRVVVLRAGAIVEELSRETLSEGRVLTAVNGQSELPADDQEEGCLSNHAK